MTQVFGHTELTSGPEEQGDHQSDEGAGDIPGPRFRKQLDEAGRHLYLPVRASEVARSRTKELLKEFK
jgi:hypothetical protein